MKNRYVVFLDKLENPDIREIGGKAASLSVLMSNGFNIPGAFAVTSYAFFHFLDYNHLNHEMNIPVDETADSEDLSSIRHSILSGIMPEEIRNEISSALAKLNISSLSVRSSAISEDSKLSSFAGMFDTYLNVRNDADEVVENVKKCWAPLFNKRAIAYRLRRSLPLMDGMAVVVQEMIDADISGTMFTVHPDGNRKLMVIEASWGLGEALVSGAVTPDSYLVNREDCRISEVHVSKKRMVVRPSIHGVRYEQLPDEVASSRCLDDAQLKLLCNTGLAIERLYGMPQDIEWCIRDRRLYILQARPITTLK